MSSINTVTGPIDTKQLGFTLMHEHVYVLSEGVIANFPRLWNREERVAQAAAALSAAKAHGVSTIVDLTVLGLGRDVSLVREIAQRSRSPGRPETRSCRDVRGAVVCACDGKDRRRLRDVGARHPQRDDRARRRLQQQGMEPLVEADVADE